MSTTLPYLYTSSGQLITSVSYTSLNLQPNWQNNQIVGFAAGANIAINSPLGPNGKLITNSMTMNANVYDGSNNALLGKYV
jgi:hypothetical protein